MAFKQTALTIGLEEELFLVDRKTGELHSTWPQAFSHDCITRYPGQIVHEFLNCQVELITKPHETVAELHRDLAQLRQHVIDTSKRYEMAPIASSTHPWGQWRTQSRSDSERYFRLEEELQLSARRMLIGGMHIHVGVMDCELRVKLFNYLLDYLPLMLCLSTSSPFWSGTDSGLSSSRLSVLNALPRSGLPDYLTNYANYKQFVDNLVTSGAIETDKEIWWDIRLNANYPTVEVRIADTCTRIDDAMALVALVQCLARSFLIGKPLKLFQTNHLLRLENRWRAQRHSVLTDKFLLTKDTHKASVSNLVDCLLEQLREHACALACEKYLNHLNTIVKKGTSADNQRLVYNEAINKGKPIEQSQKLIVDFLVHETSKGCYVKEKKNHGHRFLKDSTIT